MSLQSTISSLRTRRMLTWFVPAVGLALYLILVPQVPDFAAQATRAAIFDRLGSVTWWPGWYGGMELPTYSVLAPGIMATIGHAVGSSNAGVSPDNLGIGKKKGRAKRPFFVLRTNGYQFVPERQIVGSHFSAIADLQVHTVLPTLAPKIGENVSVEPSMLEFARCGALLENVALMTPPETLSSSTNLPVIEIAEARPADALIDGA